MAAALVCRFRDTGSPAAASAVAVAQRFPEHTVEGTGRQTRHVVTVPLRPEFVRAAMDLIIALAECRVPRVEWAGVPVPLRQVQKILGCATRAAVTFPDDPSRYCVTGWPPEGNRYEQTPRSPCRLVATVNPITADWVDPQTRADYARANLADQGVLWCPYFRADLLPTQLSTSGRPPAGP